MVAPGLEHFDYDMEVLESAAKNWENRRDQREENKTKAAMGRLEEVETPERIEANARYKREARQRLARWSRGGLEAAAVAAAAAVPTGDFFHERVVGDRDFLGIEFLEMAMAVARFVGRVHIRQRPNVTAGFGTGFVVSPRLFLTNNHVLPNPDWARHSEVEFDYQKDRFGRPLPIVICALEPDTFFLTNKDLDFTLVAVREKSHGGPPLTDYAWVRLRPASGKALIGQPLNIIQHPRGEMKQLVLRSNKLVDVFDDFLHYETDTDPGSSGSPVFSDLWDVVGIHHAGVAKKDAQGNMLDVNGKVWKKGRDDPDNLAWVGNEGVRVSSIIKFVEDAKLDTSAKKALRKDLLEKEPPHPLERMQVPSEPPPEQPELEPPIRIPQPRIPIMTGENTVTVTIPLQITISLGAPQSGMTGVMITPGAVEVDDEMKEVVKPDPSDPSYKNRKGFDRKFLAFTVPFPKLTNVSKAKAFQLPGVNGDDKFELKYHHYSVLFNKARKLAFVAGVNFDPTAPEQFQREGKDKWYLDPRVKPTDLQAGEALYAGNPLDRGHLVRRADAAWGHTEKEAKLANDDTFHFTNCSPQHEITNQGKLKQAPPGLKLWGKLEDHVASQGKKGKRKLCIFNGPVFGAADRTYRGVKIPKEFWKAVVFANDDGEPAAAAFVLTQAALIQGLKEEFEVGEYKAVQVRIKDLEAKTDLDFGPFRGWDVMEKEGAEESFSGDAAAVVLNDVTDIVL